MSSSPSLSSGLLKDDRQHSHGPAELDELARQLIELALAVPTEQLSDVGSWHSHVPFAYAVMALHRPRCLVELGVHKGDSYLTFCQAFIDHDIPGKAFGVDTWQGDPQAGFYDGDTILESLKQKHDSKYGEISTLIRKTFDKALDDIKDRSVDLLHIDGLHTYEAVKRDFENWLPKLSEHGIVLFHDTQVTRDDFGVWQLWQEISANRESYEFPYGNGLGVLLVGKEVGNEVRDLLRLLRENHQVFGLPARELLARIGVGIADAKRVVSLSAEIDRIEQERLGERASAQAQFGRLNSKIEFLSAANPMRALLMRVGLQAVRGTRVAVQSGSNLLNISNEKDRNTDECNLEATEESTEELPPPNFAKWKSRIDAARLKQKQRAFRLLENARHGARIAGRNAIEKLPVSQASKIRLKYAILSVVAPLFGLKRGGAQPPPIVHVGETALKLSDDRYRHLAAVAHGHPCNIPERSVSIIIPVYNQLAYTLGCIEAIKANTSEIDYEIIVVDDCSSDKTQATLSVREDITYLRNETNLGFIGSCNAGARRSNKTYLCFLNNDTRVLPFWLSGLVNTFELHENVGLAGSKLVYPDGRLQEAGGLIWNDGSGWNWGRLHDPNEPRFAYARQTDYCSGASVLLPRALFAGLGGFDPLYAPAYGEDSDLCFKIRSLGLATIYQPLSQVIHFEGVTSGTDTSQGVKKYQIANGEKLAIRWAPVLAHQGEPGVNADYVSDRGIVGRILVLDQITPEPDRDAGSITALELMRALRDLGNKITFVPCSNLCHLSPYSELLSALGIEVVILPWTGSVEKHLMDRGSTYDAVLIFRPNTWADHIDAVRKYCKRSKIIYHVSDLHFLREQRADEIGKGSFSAPGRQDALKQSELDLISSSDLCIVHSTAEKELLEKLRPEARVVCFPWIYEPRGRGEPFGQRTGLIFVGGYRHAPNVDAVENYVANIHPLLIDRLPAGATFTAAGSFPPPSLQSLSDSTISVPGYVNDIAPLLFGSRVMVAPLRYGAGIKGKLLSAMAHGLPIVTTTVGAEGMGLVDGEHVLVADKPDEFADAVLRLYNDQALWERLQRAGLDYISDTTSRKAGLKTVAAMLAQINRPFVPRRVPTNAADDVRVSPTFGSRIELSDLTELAAAGMRSWPKLTEAIDLMVIPDCVPLPHPTPSGVATVSTYSDFFAQSAAPKKLLMIVDTTDAPSLKALAETLRNRLSSEASCLAVFVPPRLVASSSGYEMLAPFSDRNAGEITAPFHESMAEHFSMPERETSWIIDTSLTGFPALTMLHIAGRKPGTRDP